MSGVEFHRDPAGELALDLKASINGYPEWQVWAYVILTPGGTASLGELRLLPRGFSDDGEEHPLAAEVPLGGIPARLVRAINAGELLSLAQRAASEAADKFSRDKKVHSKAFVAFANATSQRPGRKGHPIEHYLAWAERYVEKLRAGSRRPIAELASDTDWDQTYVRDTIRDARNKYGLLTPTGQGRAGGELTAKALELIEKSHETRRAQGNVGRVRKRSQRV
jgi:hypothetical protein